MNSVFVKKTDDTSGETKMVGVYINKTDADRLAMLSLEKGVPRTSILRGIIDGLLKDAPDLPTMIELAVNRAVTHWEDDILPNTSLLALKGIKKGFLTTTENSLKSNRIDPALISTIIMQIREKVYEA